MITCTKCGLEQPASNFCGGCGAPLAQAKEVKKEPVQPEAQPVTPPPTTENVHHAQPKQSKKPNITMESLKQHSGNYWHYFVETLKHPSKMGDVRYFNFGLISTIISLILYALIPVIFANKMINSLYGFVNAFSNGAVSGSGLLGIGTFIRVFLYLGIFYVLLVAIILLLSRKLGTMENMKQGIAQLGAFNNVLNVAFLATLVLLLLNSVAFAFLLYALIALVFVYLVPLFLASHYFMKHPTKDAFISFLITIITTLVYVVIYYSIFFDKISNDMNLSSFFDLMNL